MSAPVTPAPELPEGWDVVQLAESRLREALARWDKNINPALCLERGEALAECARALLAELDADRAHRQRGTS